MLGPNLIRNPDCILALQEWGVGTLGPDDWISFNGDLNMGNQQSVIPNTGTFKLILTYESDGPFRAIVGNAPPASVPASAGGVFTADFAVTDPAYSGITFQDRSESVVGRILRAELREIT